VVQQFGQGLAGLALAHGGYRFRRLAYRLFHLVLGGAGLVRLPDLASPGPQGSKDQDGSGQDGEADAREDSPLLAGDPAQRRIYNAPDCFHVTTPGSSLQIAYVQIVFDLVASAASRPGRREPDPPPAAWPRAARRGGLGSEKRGPEKRGKTGADHVFHVLQNRGIALMLKKMVCPRFRCSSSQ
jgi:hypothetical protein